MAIKLFKEENIITGLLYNLLRKNTTYGKEGFKVYDEQHFIVELDISGFDFELIKNAVTELDSDPEWHHYDSGTIILSADITFYESNIKNESIKFLIPKDKLIKLRNSLIKP